MKIPVYLNILITFKTLSHSMLISYQFLSPSIIHVSHSPHRVQVDRLQGAQAKHLRRRRLFRPHPTRRLPRLDRRQKRYAIICSHWCLLWCTIYVCICFSLNHMICLFCLSLHSINILQPTANPSQSPSKSPSKEPSVSPSANPTKVPTGSPSKQVS